MSSINYKAAPVAAKFHGSEAFIRGIMGPIGCVKGDVEFLSPSGWVRMDAWDGHEVAVWNPDGEKVHFEVPEYVKLPATKWYKFKSRTRFEMDMSEEHKMPVTYMSKKCGGEPTERFEVYDAPSLAKLEGRKKLFHHYEYPNRKGRLSDAEIRFAVAVNADGYLDKNCVGRIVFGFVKERKIDRMRGLLSELGYSYTERRYDCKKSSTGSYTTFRVNSPYLQKTFTGDFWWSMGGDELNVVMDEIHRWDGTVKGAAKTCRVFTTTREDDVPFIQHAAAASGFRATVGIEIKDEKYKPQYCVNLIRKESPKGRVSIRRSSMTVEEAPATNGEVKYCFTTSTGFFVIRVNNQVVITSNSGKSVACCIEMFRISSQVQEPGPDGIRKTRWLVVRNTLPQLETTTIKTWCDWFPPKTFGRMTGKPPYTHFVRYGDVDMEVIFIALDKPEDVKKLLSFECTGIWFNEAREINKELIDAATGRVGRYPSAKDGGCTWSGIIMDTNPPDDSHWWYHFAEENEWCRDKEGRLRDPEDVPPTERWEFFKQPSGLDLEKAENLENHMQPKNREALSLEERRKLGLRYYERMIPGKTPEWVNVYVHGNYGFIQDGKPVYKSSWNDEVHTAKEEIQIPPSAPLIAGVDCSGRNPAVVWLWKSPLGSYKVIDELVCQDIGAVAFSKLLSSEQKRRFPMNETVFYGDPAGSFKAMTDERTYVDILRAEGINVYPAPTNNVTDRTQSVEGALLRLCSDGPAFLVDKKCKILRRGFNGGYKYRKLNVSGEARYDPKPEKNRFSDVQDALQYAMLGAGEGRAIRGYNGRKQRKAPVAKSDFKVF